MKTEDKKAIIRRNFEAARDFTWIARLEPRFWAQGMDTEGMKSFREAWNRHAEERDWGWWQERAKNYSDERLQDMEMDTTEMLDAIGCLEWQRKKEQAGFDNALDQAAKHGGKSVGRNREPER